MHAIAVNVALHSREHCVKEGEFALQQLSAECPKHQHIKATQEAK